MHIVISVGHQKALALIPVECVPYDNHMFRDALNSVAQRLEGLVKKRCASFTFTTLGANISRVDPNDANYIGAETINVIADVVAYAEVLHHDCIAFDLVHSIETFTGNLLATMERNCADEHSLGVHRVVLQERDRLQDVVSHIEHHGIKKPEIFW